VTASGGIRDILVEDLTPWELGKKVSFTVADATLHFHILTGYCVQGDGTYYHLYASNHCFVFHKDDKIKIWEPRS
jgi:hypothetical protein